MKRRVETALKHNLKDVIEHGPRLSYGRQTAVVATCVATKRMLLTGLGAMGVGTVWVDYDANRAARDEAPDFSDEAMAERWWFKEGWSY